MAVERSDLEPFIMSPERSPNTLSDPSNNVGNQAKRLFSADNETKKCGWATLKSFMKGMSKNIREVLDLDHYKDLEHVDHGYKNVKPINHIRHLETEH